MEQHRTQLHFADACVAPERAHLGHGSCRVGHILGAVDHKTRPGAVGALIAGVVEIGDQTARQLAGKAGGIALVHQHFAGQPVPVASPALVGPAEVKGEIHIHPPEKPVDRLFQQPGAVEPVVIDAEGIDPGITRQRRLFAHHLRQAQIVKAEIRGQGRLGVVIELWLGTAGGGPFGEPLAPPVVVFRHRVELRQVEGGHIARRRGRGHGVRAAQFGGLADCQASGRADQTKGALQCMCQGAVGLPLLHIKIVKPKRQAAQHVQEGRFHPVDRPGGEIELIGLCLQFDFCQQALAAFQVAAPPFTAVVMLPVSDPEAAIFFSEEALQQLCRLALGQDALGQMCAPGVSVLAVRGFLGVQLADCLVVIEPAGC